MNTLKRFLRKLPVLPLVYKALVSRYVGYKQRSKSTEEIFSEIKDRNVWGGSESVSGVGSDSDQTKLIAQKIPMIISEHGIREMLDIPCGDFHWMQGVDLGEVNYTGADIVEDLVRENREKHTNQGVRFEHIDLIRNELPRVDMVFCRDCLVHLPFADIFLALENICKSGSTYLLTTTFTGRARNADIATGQWRALNLQIAPFMLPAPVDLIYEGLVEGGGEFDDKALGLWKIADIESCLTNRLV